MNDLFREDFEEFVASKGVVLAKTGRHVTDEDELVYEVSDDMHDRLMDLEDDIKHEFHASIKDGEGRQVIVHRTGKAPYTGREVDQSAVSAQAIDDAATGADAVKRAEDMGEDAGTHRNPADTKEADRAKAEQAEKDRQVGAATANASDEAERKQADAERK